MSCPAILGSEWGCLMQAHLSITLVCPLCYHHSTACSLRTWRGIVQWLGVVVFDHNSWSCENLQDLSKKCHKAAFLAPLEGGPTADAVGIPSDMKGCILATYCCQFQLLQGLQMWHSGRQSCKSNFFTQDLGWAQSQIYMYSFRWEQVHSNDTSLSDFCHKSHEDSEHHNSSLSVKLQWQLWGPVWVHFYLSGYPPKMCRGHHAHCTWMWMSHLGLNSSPFDVFMSMECKLFYLDKTCSD